MDKYCYSIYKMKYTLDDSESTTSIIEKKITNDLKECFDKALEFKASHPKSFFELYAGEGGSIEFEGTEFETFCNFTIVEEHIEDGFSYEFCFGVIHQDNYP